MTALQDFCDEQVIACPRKLELRAAGNREMPAFHDQAIGYALVSSRNLLSELQAARLWLKKSGQIFSLSLWREFLPVSG